MVHGCVAMGALWVDSSGGVPPEPIAEAKNVDWLLAAHHGLSHTLVIICLIANDALKM